MVWSLVEEVDEEIFENCVQNISVHIRESPRLEDLLRVCAGFRSWLEADANHVVRHAQGHVEAVGLGVVPAGQEHRR